MLCISGASAIQPMIVLSLNDAMIHLQCQGKKYPPLPNLTALQEEKSFCKHSIASTFKHEKNLEHDARRSNGAPTHRFRINLPRRNCVTRSSKSHINGYLCLDSDDLGQYYNNGLHYDDGWCCNNLRDIQKEGLVAFEFSNFLAQKQMKQAKHHQ